MNHPNYLDLPPQFPPDYAAAWGEDKQGLWFDLRIASVTQRFRWIPAGTFTMGSPEDEEERESWGNETQHPVTLSQGFWLADTACTQALWQLIMGENPADFNDDPENPVETVSWLDVQAFLEKLNQLIPGLQAQLPSEAQWEYACRAGTETPFSFGENITPEQVNCDGSEPYAGGEKGEYRRKTVPVKALPANPWGLYQMHGNVWEWCQDVWHENLGTSPVSDPEPPVLTLVMTVVCLCFVCCEVARGSASVGIAVLLSATGTLLPTAQWIPLLPGSLSDSQQRQTQARAVNVKPPVLPSC